MSLTEKLRVFIKRGREEDEAFSSKRSRSSSAMNDYHRLCDTLPTVLGTDSPASADDVVVLCLAHNGVHQPLAWRYWWNACSQKHRLKFIVHSPESAMHNPRFCYDNRLNLPFPPTQWCTPSLVMAYISAVRHILDSMYPTPPSMIYLVSGSDIPVCPADKMLEQDAYNRVCVVSDSAVRQWKALTGKTARRLVDFMTPEWFEATNKRLLEGYILRKKYWSCPDEAWVYDVLRQIREDVPTDYGSDEERCYTLAMMSSFKNVSPVTWTSLSDAHFLTDFEFKISLHNLLLMVNVYERPDSQGKARAMNWFVGRLGGMTLDFPSWFKHKLFLRKVGPDPLLFFSDRVTPTGEALFRVLFTRDDSALEAIWDAQWKFQDGEEEVEANPGVGVLERMETRTWTEEEKQLFYRLGMLPSI